MGDDLEAYQSERAGTRVKHVLSFNHLSDHSPS